ncbi:MAG: hypothetical protein V2B18_00855 [Pseudomonadota bacterium]
MTPLHMDLNVIPAPLRAAHKALDDLVNLVRGNIADWTLDQLLRAMSLAFELSRNRMVLLLCPNLKGYDENIRDFTGGYVFGSKDGLVCVSAIFKNDRMEVKGVESADWNVKVMFEDVQAFWKFLLAGGNDIFDSIMENDVEAYGNLNYLYKFGFMAKDLQQRLGL